MIEHALVTHEHRAEHLGAQPDGGAIDDVSFFNDDADMRFKNFAFFGTAQRQYTFGASWRHLMGNGYATVTLGSSTA